MGDSQYQRLPEDMLVRALNASSRAIDNHTQDQFWADPTPVTRAFQADVCDALYLTPSIATPGAVTISSADGGTVFIDWLATDYVLSPTDKASKSAIKIHRVTGGRRFPLNDITNVATRWGWLAYPVEVNMACLLKASSLFHRKDAPFGVATFGDFAAVRITRRDPEVMELLETYVLDVANVGGR